MALQALATYLQGLLLIPIFGVEVETQVPIHAPQQRLADRAETERIFQTGVEFRRTGLNEMAYDCFQEAARRAAGTELGRQALEQVNELAPIIHRAAATKHIAFRESGVTTTHYQIRRPQSIEGELINLHQLRTLYLKAQQLHQDRKWQQAHDMFQQVHMLAPASRFGQIAVDQMMGIDKQLTSQQRQVETRPTLEERVRRILEQTEPIEIHLEKLVDEPNWVVPAKFERPAAPGNGETTRDYKWNGGLPSFFGPLSFDVDVCRKNDAGAELSIRVGVYRCRIEYDNSRNENWRIEIYTNKP